MIDNPRNIQNNRSESPDCHRDEDCGTTDRPATDAVPQPEEEEPEPSDRKAVPLIAPPPATRRALRMRGSLLERRRGPRNLVVDTLTNSSGSLPIVIQTAGTLDRLRKSGWEDLKTPRTLPSVPFTAVWDLDENQRASATWTPDNVLSADAFRSVPDLISNDYQNFPVLMDLQCGSSPSQSAKAPLFLIHPDAGFGVAYLGLPDLDRQVYALSNSYLANGLAFRSVRDAAEIYLKHIRTIAEDGPYLLGGWGFGGNVAREMAAILAYKWAECEETESEEIKQSQKEKRRVFVMMIDSFNESWAPFQEAVQPNQTVTVPTSVPVTARDLHIRSHRKLLALRTGSPRCSPSSLSFTDRCIVTNAALKSFAHGTVQHLRDQYHLSAALLKDEDPTAFVGRPSTITRREALKSASALQMDTFAHVFLLKAGRLCNFAHSIPYNERVILTRRFLSKVNGWARPELAPGLSQWTVNDHALGENVAQVLTRVQTIPFTHNEMLSPVGCHQVGQWLRACLSATNA
ncbi:unnamed protein product [Tilletia laevis]|uniref:Thioesterase domain-containing protein n=2 Tax=Tilletia TaxID=13289 RepID=A0A177UQZ0_9BASI|nr:hypothetical protein CF336_g1422 [Tilletia laevis]KAE8264089.1 hypothetical protein A4X03_0g1199 [Tilletia caries]CAD6942491.1 unnamed protein product [Tilletia controversa]CAD6893256.1 unnamed protein product [Tilletia caries]CAD6921451.1 unnamed protein product [Tilletia caries]